MLALPALRVRGPYFGLTTLVAVLMLQNFIVVAAGLTGGEIGLTVPDVISISDKVNYEIALWFMAASGAILFALSRSPVGMILQASGQDPVQAGALGFNVTKHKIAAFVISAFFSGLAGATLIFYLGTASVGTVVDIAVGVNVIVAAVLGGRRTIIGAAVGSIFLTITWMHGTSGALWLIIWRIVQGIGGAFLFANSTAILTDAFPSNQRGTALGMNSIAAIAGSFVGLILGGLLRPINWHLIFLVSVPIGAFGTIWAYFMLKDIGVRRPARIDWWGNILFAVGLIAILVGITYGLLPYGGHPMGWTNPWVLAAIFGGVATLVAFGIVETRVAEPLFRLSLFKIRAFALGNVANLLMALGRGGMQFMLIIWLQGIWLPLHGYDFSQTPLWAGIYLVPLTTGFLAAAPLSGILSDKFGPKPFTVGGALLTGASFLLLIFVPVDFAYWQFALVIALNGFGSGLFFSPNWAEMMNSVPADRRGAAGGMIATFQNSAFVLSIGIFFTLMVAGLSSKLPAAMYSGLTAQGIPAAAAAPISHLPPIGVLFASFLGYNPMQQLLGPLLHHLTPAHAAYVAGREFFPHLITAPFHSGLGVAFGFAIAANVIAAIASALTGPRTPAPAGHESLGYELAAVAGEGAFEPAELVVTGTPEESTEPPDEP